MTRRLALAVALAFTTVVTFALVAIGAQAGMFGDGGKDSQPAEASAGQTATAQTPAPEATVVTEYIYIDQTATPGPSGAQFQDGPGGGADSSGQTSGSDGRTGTSFTQPSPAPASGQQFHEPEHEDEHEAGDD